MKDITCEKCGEPIKSYPCFIEKKEVCGLCFLKEKRKIKEAEQDKLDYL